MSQFKKIFSFVICFIMLFSNLSIDIFGKQSENTFSQNEEVQEANVKDNEQDIQNKNDQQQYGSSDEEMLGDSNLVNYFVVDKPKLNTPDNQTFILSLGSGNENIENVSIVIQSKNEEYEIHYNDKMNNLFKFEKRFDNSDSGEYKIVKIKYFSDNQNYSILMNTLDMDIRFGVNQEYDGFGESEGLVLDKKGENITDVLNNEEIAPSIAMLDASSLENNTSLIENTISNSSIATYGMEEKKYTSENPLIIALDPGHGGIDGGMTAVDGTFEKVYTLKIANYLKEELEQYNNVKVVMTRNDDSYIDLEPRCNIAKQQGASVLVSLHLNSINGRVQGAEVYYPHANYDSVVSETGKNLAQQVIDELSGLGITNRGIRVKYIYDEVTGEPAHDSKYDYPDGSVGDYYGIIRHSKLRGIAAIIVEHCYADNWNDFNLFLSSEEKIKNLAVADAKGIVKAFDLKKNDESKELDILANQNKNVIKDGYYKISSSLVERKFISLQSQSFNEKEPIILEEKLDDDSIWKVSHDEKGYILIKNVYSGQYLSSDGTVHSNIYQGCNITNNEKWIAVNTGNGIQVISATGKNRYLTLTSDQKTIQLGDNVSYSWNFIKSDYNYSKTKELAQKNLNAIKDGVYDLFNISNPYMSLGLQYDSNTKVETLHLVKDPKEGWNVIHDENGFVSFINETSNKAIEISDDCLSLNKKLFYSEFKDEKMGQKWIVYRDKSGYKIISALNEKILLSTNQNGEIVISQEEGNINQFWMINNFLSQRDKLNELAKQNKSSLLDGTYRIGSKLASNKVLDVDHQSLAENANVTIYANNGQENQLWEVSHDDKGYVMLRNVHSKKYLSVLNGVAVNVSNVGQKSLNGYASKWIAIKDGQTYKLVSGLDSNYVLDLNGPSVENGTNVSLYKGNDAANQRWEFQKHINLRDKLNELAKQNKSSLLDGTYRIGSKLASNKVLDVDHQSLAENANVTIYANNGQENQLWEVSHDDKGYVMLRNVHSKKYLSVLNGVAVNVSNVGQKSLNGYASKWIAIKDGQTYKLVSGLDSNYVLDLNGPSVENGTNVSLYKGNDAANQRWEFQKHINLRDKLNELAKQNKSSLLDGTYRIGSKLASNKVLDVDHQSLAENANVTIYANNGQENQLWEVSHDDKGYVMLRNVHSKKYLSVLNGVAVNVSNVGQKSLNGYASKWIAIKDGQTYKLVSGLDSNYVLDLNGPSVENGTNVSLYKGNDAANQRWEFIDEVLSTYHPIMGSTSTTINKMVSLFKKYNNHYDKGYKSGSKYDGILAKGGASTIEEFCKMYYEEAQAEGVKAEIAFAQAMIETGWLTFGGDVKPDQYNFAGMGATGNGVSGNSYQNVRIGIRAQIQHLKCYASKEPLNQSLVDQRWSDSLRGKAEYVEYLSIPNNPYGTGWASDKNYADKILNITNYL